MIFQFDQPCATVFSKWTIEPLNVQRSQQLFVEHFPYRAGPHIFRCLVSGRLTLCFPKISSNHTVDGRNHHPVDKYSLSHYLQCFSTIQTVVVWDFFLVGRISEPSTLFVSKNHVNSQMSLFGVT